MALKPNPATNLWPIGHVAHHAGVTVDELEQVITANGFEPIFWILGVPHFSMLQAVALEGIVRRQREGAADPQPVVLPQKPSTPNLAN